MKKIYSFFGEESEIFTKLNDKAKAYAATRDIAYTWEPQPDFCDNHIAELLQNADGAIIDIEPYGEPIFSKIRGKNKILVRFGVGFDQVDLPSATANGVAVARTTGANTTAVAEMALMLMLNARRKFTSYQKCIANGEWTKEVGNEIIGSTVGIAGFGIIGQTLAKLLSGFDCEILIYDPFPDQKALEAYGARSVSLETLFEQSDAISIHMPYMEATHHVVNERILGLMQESAVLVNTARGNLVDENALYRVLKDKKIAGAAFDVFAVEPLPKDSPLRDLENMIITPHVSSQTEQSLWNIYKVAIDIMADFYAGKDSSHILNKDYKAFYDA